MSKQFELDFEGDYFKSPDKKSEILNEDLLLRIADELLALKEYQGRKKLGISFIWDLVEKYQTISHRKITNEEGFIEIICPEIKRLLSSHLSQCGIELKLSSSKQQTEFIKSPEDLKREKADRERKGRKKWPDDYYDN